MSLGVSSTARRCLLLIQRDGHIRWHGGHPHLLHADSPLVLGAWPSSVVFISVVSDLTHSLNEVIYSHDLSYHCYADDTELILQTCFFLHSSRVASHHLNLNPSKTDLLFTGVDTSPGQDLMTLRILGLNHLTVHATLYARINN